MSALQEMPPDLPDRIRVIVMGPGQMRIVLECAICDEPLVLSRARKAWRCENCGINTTQLELAGIFQDCVDALGGDPPPPERKSESEPREERLGVRWRKILLETIQRQLQKDD